MITGFKGLLKVQRIQSENFWKCQKNNVTTKTISKKQDKTNENDIEASHDYDSDHYSEIDANDHVGNIDTLVDADIDSKYDKAFTFAPGKGQHPLSLYQDKDAEYVCFPSIFCGQTPPSRDERLVPAHYSDIVKWELRGVDRRATQSVPNERGSDKRVLRASDDDVEKSLFNVTSSFSVFVACYKKKTLCK